VSVEKKSQLTPNFRGPVNFIGAPRGHFIFFVYIYTNIIAIIVGLFMPYVYGVLPIDVMFRDSIDLSSILGLTIPILVIIPFLLILIFKDLLGNINLSVLKVFFVLLYFIVLANYRYFFYDSFNSIFDESFEILIPIVLSLNLVLLNLKYTIRKSDELQNIILAIMTLPFILYFIAGVTSYIDDFNYGYYIINISLISLYSLALNTVYKNRNIKKFGKKE